ncbi:MAG: MBL fold metallo-hydrolase [Firmicutes bacterium]|nr:MBL fold metallo-hydrolase [Bacillota bacterium]
MKKKNTRFALCVIMGLALILYLVIPAIADAATKQISVTYGGISIVVDGTKITPKDANGKVVEPLIFDGTTYVPARAIAEALGKDVDWEPAAQTVYIGKKPLANTVESGTKLLYQGHSSLRFTAENGTVMYVDPYIGNGYDMPADIILITHEHSDHNDLEKIKTQNPDCTIIRVADAISEGKLKTFNVKGITIEAVAAENSLHTTKGPLDPNNPWLVMAVGYIITIDGIKVYVSGDTDTTDQMKTFAEKKLDYAFFVCDGIYNMSAAEAAACAKTIGAQHNIPYHTNPDSPDASFDMAIATAFAAAAPNSLILKEDQEITLDKN